MAACAKHFPGHGSTAGDSHRELATVAGTMQDLRVRDLPPFVAAVGAESLAMMPGHLRVPELTGELPATLSPAAITGLLRGELGFDGVVICDALEMKAASAAFGIPEAAVLAVIAGTDLLCLGRDTDEAMYHAVRSALADAVTSGRLPAQRLEEAAARVAGLRARLAADRDASGIAADGAVGAGDGIGLVAARRALRSSGPVPGPLTDPLVVEVEPEENIAAGRFPWGFEPWADVHRVEVADGDGAAAAGDSRGCRGPVPGARGAGRPRRAPADRRPGQGAPRPDPRRDGGARLGAAGRDLLPGHLRRLAGLRAGGGGGTGPRLTLRNSPSGPGVRGSSPGDIRVLGARYDGDFCHRAPSTRVVR